MTPTFPALAFARDAGPYSEPGREKVEWFGDTEDYSTCEVRDLKYGRRQGMTLVCGDLRCWKVVSVRDLGVFREFGLSWPILLRPLRFLVRRRFRRIDQEVVEIDPMTLDQIKARAVASLLANPDDWRDDELIAGEAGPPRDEQELLDEIAAAVFAARSVPQIINALFEEELEG